MKKNQTFLSIPSAFMNYFLSFPIAPMLSFILSKWHWCLNCYLIKTPPIFDIHIVSNIGSIIYFFSALPQSWGVRLAFSPTLFHNNLMNVIQKMLRDYYEIIEYDLKPRPVATERDKFPIFTMCADIHGATIGRITTVNYFFDVFHYNSSWF